MDASKPTVPKFSSFRPKTSQKPASEVDRCVQPEGSNQHRKKRHRSHSPDNRHHLKSSGKEYGTGSRSPKRRARDGEGVIDRESHRHRRRLKHKSDRKPRELDDNQQALASGPSFPAPIIIPWEQEEDAWVIDRKGDPKNLTYGGIHRYSIPHHRRYGYGHILGLPRYLKIDRNLSSEKEVVIVDERRNQRWERLLAKKSSKLKDIPSVQIIKSGLVQSTSDYASDFIPLSDHAKRSRDSASPVSESGDVNYRSIEGKAKPNYQPSDPDIEVISESEPQDALQDEDRRIQQQNTELTRRTHLNPTDVSAWMALIDHQEMMLRLGSRHKSGDLTTSEERNLANVRISVFEKALKNVEDATGRQQLLLGMLNEGNKIWHSEEANKQWQTALKEFSTAIDIWRKYLDFIQTNFLEFTYQSCISMFKSCLGMLRSSSQTATATSDPQALEDIQCYMLLRLSSMMEEAGYQELALAIWQALMEYHIFRPSALREDDLLSAFEEYWDSEAPRIGEPGAKGWKNNLAAGSFDRDPAVIRIEALIDADDPLSSFANSERRLVEGFSMPGRLMDHGGEDDVFHVVLSADVKEILELLPNISSPTTLVDAFLCFAQLPPLQSAKVRSHALWWSDPFLRSAQFRFDGTLPEPGAIMPQCQLTPEVLFSTLFADNSSRLPTEFLRCCLRQLAVEIVDDSVAEYYLAFESNYYPDNAAKQAKSFLERRSTSLRLYNAYSLIEIGQGNIKRALTAISKILSMSNSLTETAQKDKVLLWRTWVWQALESGDQATAMHRLIEIVSDKPKPYAPEGWMISDVSPATVLSVSTTLADLRDFNFSNNCPKYAVYAAELLTLFSYLRNSFSISAAISAFSETSVRLATYKLTGSASDELHHQLFTQLLIQHTKHNMPYAPSLIRQPIESSIRLFPQNTILLSAYAELESRFRIDDRVRSIMREVARHQSSGSGTHRNTLIPHFFTIAHELKLHFHDPLGDGSASAGRTPYTLRAAFEAAIRDVPHSSALWRAYVQFELYRTQQVKGKKERQNEAQRAKSVFLRGLVKLPWCKSFMMLGVEEPELRTALGMVEVGRVLKAMQEKGMRIYTNLDTVIEMLEKRVGEVGRFNEASEADKLGSFGTRLPLQRIKVDR